MAKALQLEGKRVGSLLVLNRVPEEEKKENYKGSLWYCQCDCGNIVQARGSYLSGNGNYTQTSCGCKRKVRAFLASTKMPITEDFLDEFLNDFEKFLFIHKQLTVIGGKSPLTYNYEEYQNDIKYFYYQEQFNTLYLFWKGKVREDTFYDWAKPSLDHKIPKSKGGNNKKENLQFLTVFENLAKRDMTTEEWTSFKERTNTKSDYFIETIMERR